MPTLQQAPSRPRKSAAAVPCYHCGTPCPPPAAADARAFCCDGCRLVYDVLNGAGLCDYYTLQSHPGLGQIKPLRRDKFAFLDDERIVAKLCAYTDGDLSVVTFYLPGVHCSSCMWLLEHLPRLNPAILHSRLDFGRKEVTVRFRRKAFSLRQVAELLATIGYEPYISLDDEGATAARRATSPTERMRLYRLGVAGFCFTFIMMMSFPEYFGGVGFEEGHAHIFRYLNLLLGIPVFFFCAGEFFGTAWKGLKAKTLNIDAPIALAVLITFGRSLWEILSGTDAGYLDSMSGIVFFMLVGRVVQERTYRSLHFHRDYRSYFPLAATVLVDGAARTRSLHDLQPGDIVRIGSEEIIPADGTVLEGTGRIDYAFVTGESEPVRASEGAAVWAGGRQTGGALVVRIDKPVAGSYLTQLWNAASFRKDKESEGRAGSSIHALSRYFTIILFTLAGITAAYWAAVDPARLLPSVTAMLIVACPCALLLSSTFTNGSMLRLFSNAGLYLRDAPVIERLARITHIVFDKTGTLTDGVPDVESTGGRRFSAEEAAWLRAVAAPSRHPMSRALMRYLGTAADGAGEIAAWCELPGQGVSARVDGHEVRIGSAAFTGTVEGAEKAAFYVRIADRVTSFGVAPRFRRGLAGLVMRLRRGYQLSLLSGDNSRQRAAFAPLFDAGALHFDQRPEDKLHFIESLQHSGERVLMVGDGLNDAGALQQSDAGITLADDVNNFTPACDAILDAAAFSKLGGLLALARWGQYTVRIAFAVSVVYNLVGLWFAVQGKMNPMIAAILMPVSTLSIVLISVGVSRVAAWWLLGRRVAGYSPS